MVQSRPMTCVAVLELRRRAGAATVVGLCVGEQCRARCRAVHVIAGAVACQGLTDVHGEGPCRLWRRAMCLCREGEKTAVGRAGGNGNVREVELLV